MVNAEEWFMAYSKKKKKNYHTSLFSSPEENQNNKKKIQEIKERKVFDRTKIQTSSWALKVVKFILMYQWMYEALKSGDRLRTQSFERLKISH